MDLYNLGTVPWRDSQLLYHALAYLGREGLILLQPDSPYVCIGYHQDARQEVELDFLHEQGIPVFRREVGGGAVYLDRGQLFYQLVMRADRDDVPASKDAFYRKFLAPVVETFRDFGVEASFKPVNDIIVNNRKISGNGAAEIEGMVILVGNFLIDFNYEMMARSLKVPDEKFRDKVQKSMRQALTTLTQELGTPPSIEELSERLVERYAPLLGPLTPRRVDDALRAEAERLWREKFGRPDWLTANDRRQPDLRRVRIAEGVNVVQRVYKAPGGLIRATAIERDGKLYDVHLSGDFFFFPAGGLPELEADLEGVSAEREAVESRIADFYRAHSVEAPGVTPADFATALMGQS
ncbi:MAG TPA: lipoate--protein ligase family protein [Chloroflexi bacterium]|nr:lipoate--protein ligase family protein [Chloroflexota bacterium]